MQLNSYYNIKRLFFSNSVEIIHDITPLHGFDQCNSDFIAGHVNDLAIVDVCAITCLSSDCYEQTGVWTSAVPHHLTGTQFDGSNYFIPASIDAFGEGWFIEVGGICESNYSFDVTLSYVGIGTDGRFLAEKLNLLKYKFIRLYRVTPTEIILENQIVNFPYNCLPCNQWRYLIQPQGRFNWDINTIDQYQVPLDELAIGLIGLITSEYHLPSSFGQMIFSNTDEKDPLLQKIILANVNYLTDLINYSQDSLDQAIGRQGSLTKVLWQFYEPWLTYGERADQLQVETELHFIEPGCNDCAEVVPNNIAFNREVNNKALGWLLLALTMFWSRRRQYHIDAPKLQSIELGIVNLANYLTTQISIDHQVYHGWSDAEVLIDSLRIDDHDFCTNAIVSLGLNNAWQVIGDRKYLDHSYDLYETVRQRIRAEDFTEQAEILYALIFLQIHYEYSSVERLLEVYPLNPNLVADFTAAVGAFPEDTWNNLIADWPEFTQGQVVSDRFNYYLSLYSLFLNLADNQVNIVTVLDYQQNAVGQFTSNLLDLTITGDENYSFRNRFDQLAITETRKITFLKLLYRTKFIDYIPYWVPIDLKSEIGKLIEGLCTELAINSIYQIKLRDKYQHITGLDEQRPWEILPTYRLAKDKFGFMLEQTDIQYEVIDPQEEIIEFCNSGWLIGGNSFDTYYLRYYLNSPYFGVNRYYNYQSYQHYLYRARAIEPQVVEHNITESLFFFAPSIIEGIEIFIDPNDQDQFPFGNT